MIQNIGMAGMNWGLGKANDVAGASAAHPSGYQPMLQILTLMGIIGQFWLFCSANASLALTGTAWRRSLRDKLSANEPRGCMVKGSIEPKMPGSFARSCHSGHRRFGKATLH